MKFKIGFATDPIENSNKNYPAVINEQGTVRSSVVRVHFPSRGLTCSYYNDAFELIEGDTVYVEGKLEGLRGIVVEVSYNFKIKLSDYKRVIGKADTDVHGNFYVAGSHFLAFDASVIPFEKVITWFRAPLSEDDEIITGTDDSVSFYLDDLKGMNVSSAIAERGFDYYTQNRVVYISVVNGQGHAIVEGTEPYELEFVYDNGEITSLTCSCYCSGNCKHGFAAMLQLRETLDVIEKHYAPEYEKSGSFAAILKSALFSYVVDNRKTGTITL